MRQPNDARLQLVPNMPPDEDEGPWGRSAYPLMGRRDETVKVTIQPPQEAYPPEQQQELSALEKSIIQNWFGDLAPAAPARANPAASRSAALPARPAAPVAPATPMRNRAVSPDDATELERRWFREEAPPPRAAAPLPLERPVAREVTGGAHRQELLRPVTFPELVVAEPAAYEPEPAPTYEAPAAYEPQPVAYEPQPAAYGQAPVAYEQAPAYEPQPAAYEPQPAAYEQAPAYEPAPATAYAPEAPPAELAAPPAYSYDAELRQAPAPAFEAPAFEAPPSFEARAHVPGAEEASVVLSSELEQPKEPERRAGPPPLGVMPEGRGKVIVVFGCRGGAGATTVTANLASAIAATGQSTCVVDLDLQLGDLFVALDLEPTCSMLEVARDAPNLDVAGLRRKLSAHDKGFHALSQVLRPEEVDADLVHRLPELLGLMRKAFDVIVIDGVRDFSESALCALDLANEVLLVAGADVLSTRRASRVLRLLRKLGYADSRVKLLLNHADRIGAVSQSEVERALELEAFGSIRHDPRGASKALNRGKLLSDVGSSAAADFKRVAARLAPAPGKKG